MRAAGLRLERELGSLDSPVNYYPMSRRAWRRCCAAPLYRVLGYRLTNRLFDSEPAFIRGWLPRLARAASARDRTPGRLHTFVAEKE